MAGARPPGAPPVASVYNDDEDENSADSVEQAALEGARRDESLLDPDSLMFEELDDERQQPVGDEDEEEEEEQVTVGRKGREYLSHPMTQSDVLFDETDSIINTPYGSPLSDISSITGNQRWIGEVKKMLLDDQRKSENRTKAWAASQSEAIPTLSPPAGGLNIPPPLGCEWKEELDDALPEMGFDMPSTEELAEKYSHELIEKDLLILEKDKRISNLEKTQRDLESTLEDCQKELRMKNETATSGVEKLKRTLEEKDKSIMETSERLRKVTESYNSSEKRWKEQQEFLEKQIQKLKSELEDKSTLDDEVQRLTEASRREKESLEQKLEAAKEENDLLKQRFSQEKKQLEEELQQLRDEKIALESDLREEIEVLQTQLLLSEQAVENAVNEKEAIRVELESLEERNRILSSSIDELKGKEDTLSQNQSQQQQELETLISELRQQLEEKEEKLSVMQKEFQLEKENLMKTLEEKEEHFAATERDLQLEKENLRKEMEERQEQFAAKQRELQVEKESMLQEIEEAKERVEVEEAPINFFTQNNEASTTESWTETKKSLEDRIAELELEKGNLLLQLVDVDEHEQQEAQKNAAAATLAEESAAQLKSLKDAFEELQRTNTVLDNELQEAKRKEAYWVETAITSTAWEEKYESLQKENATLAEELNSTRQAADDLSRRHEELEQKVADLESGKPPIEGLIEIDKCDGWSDGAPQFPDEGPDLDVQIVDLTSTVARKDEEIKYLLEVQRDLETRVTSKNDAEEQFERRHEEVVAENSTLKNELQECKQELETVRDMLLEKINQLQEQLEQQQVTSVTAVPAPVSAEGWNDDAPVLFDEGFNEDNQLTELKQELEKKTEELAAQTQKSKVIEDKLKKALKALKQKNDKLAELKNRLGEDVMTASTASPMETSLVVEPLVGKSSASETGSSPTISQEIDRWRGECEKKDRTIQHLEEVIRELKINVEANQSTVSGPDGLVELVEQRDRELANLRNELAQHASALDSKNEEVVQLMKACEEMQKSIDEKVELLNDCVAKKDVEVRQAISQYEDFLKDATLNVSHLTKELEEKIREINQLNAQLLDAQQQAIEIQNEYDAYREETQMTEDNLEKKELEVKQLKKAEEQLKEELNRFQTQLDESLNNHAIISEALDRAEAEKKQLREESVCIQNEYGNKNRELQVQISQLIDQLNERESAISVMEARLKESDEASDKTACEIRYQLDEKSKALEQIEQSLFVKTEECVRMEERLRESEENFRREFNSKVAELQEQHKLALQEYATQTSSDLEQTCEQLARKNDEVVQLQARCSQLQDQLDKLQQEYNHKCAMLDEMKLMKTEIATMKEYHESNQTQIEFLSSSIHQSAEQLEAKQQEINNLKLIISQYEEKSYSAALNQEEMQRVLQETQSALAQCQHDLGAYYNELQKSQGENGMLRQSLEECQQRIERLNADVSEAKTEAARHETEVQNMTNQVAKYQDIESNLNRYLDDLNSATEELGKRNSEFIQLEKTLKTQEVQIQTLEANVESNKTELSDVYKMLAEKEERISQAQQEILGLRNASASHVGLSEKTKELLEELEEKNREISDLRFELEEGIIQEKRLKENLDSRENEIKQLRNLLEEKEREIEDAWQSFKFTQSSTPLPSETELEAGPVLDRLEKAEKEKENLERKVDLLQNKLKEVEDSEIKCYEDFSRLKMLRTELEMDNLHMSAELEQLRRSLQSGDNDPKYKAMENQLILMTKTLEDRDKLCRDLMKNISQLQESYDALRIRVNSMAMPQPFALPPDSLESKFVEQDREIFSLRVDLEREKKIRELYEGQLFLATSKKQFENSTKKSTSSGSWFGLGELFSSPPPPPSRPSPSPSSRSSVSTSLAPPSAPPYFDPSASPLGRPVTPVTPASAFSSSLFDTSGQAVQGQQYFVPQVSPGPSSPEGTVPAQLPPSNVVESPYANFPTQP